MEKGMPVDAGGKEFREKAESIRKKVWKELWKEETSGGENMTMASLFGAMSVTQHNNKNSANGQRDTEELPPPDPFVRHYVVQ